MLLPATGMGLRGSTAFVLLQWSNLQFLILPDHLGDDPDRYSRPHHPRRGRRGPQSGFCADVARQRSLGTGGDAPRAEECDAAGHGRNGAVRLSARRLDPRRNRFHLAGSGFLLSKAMITRDVPALQGTILVLSLAFVRTNLG